MELIAVGEALDGGDFALMRLEGQNRAGLDAFAVQQDGASAAEGCVAANVGAGEVQSFADKFNEHESRLDGALVESAVYLDGDGNEIETFRHRAFPHIRGLLRLFHLSRGAKRLRRRASRERESGRVCIRLTRACPVADHIRSWRIRRLFRYFVALWPCRAAHLPR